VAGGRERSTESIFPRSLRCYHPFPSRIPFHLFLSLLTCLRLYYSMELDDPDFVAAALDRRDAYFSCEFLSGGKALFHYRYSWQDR
jgi:hypothetical protein